MIRYHSSDYELVPARLIPDPVGGPSTGAPIKPGQCRAHLSDGTGRRCRKQAIAGAVVCRFHGGGAPQVKKKATERLSEMIHPALTRLNDVIEDRGIVPLDCPTGLRAAIAVLDRTGFHPTQRLITDPETLTIGGNGGNGGNGEQSTNISIDALPLDLRLALLKALEAIKNGEPPLARIANPSIKPYSTASSAACLADCGTNGTNGTNGGTQVAPQAQDADLEDESLDDSLDESLEVEVEI